MEVQEGLTLVVGLGLIGGSVARGLEAAGWIVEGVDPDPEARRAALAAGAVRQVHPDLTRLGSEPRLVVLAAPPRTTMELVRHPWPAHAIVTDCASVKSAVIESVPHLLRTRFVGGHPMAGNEGKGFDASSGDLFRGRPWIVTPTGETSRQALRGVEDMIHALGGDPVRMSPQEHDRHVALLSHLPNLLAAILVKMANDLDRTDVAGGSWRDATRVAGSNAELWAEILEANGSEVRGHIDQMVKHLQIARDALATPEDKALLELLRGENRE